jgi:hypothetical protein
MSDSDVESLLPSKEQQLILSKIHPAAAATTRDFLVSIP